MPWEKSEVCYPKQAVNGVVIKWIRVGSLNENVERAQSGIRITENCRMVITLHPCCLYFTISLCNVNEFNKPSTDLSIPVVVILP